MSRLVKVFAYDPQLGRRRRNRIALEIPDEPLEPGPQGRLVRVVDYDGGSGRFYAPIHLDEPQLRAAGGLEPRVDDPQFHQQMAYAVAAKVAANFERALGRPLRTQPVTILPHAFEARNAFFDPITNALCFGYFQADPDDPGDNIPNQLVFTCLSHDIVAHEMTHALLHGLRPGFLYATNPDVRALHEAIADIVAIFQHFAFPGLLSDAVERQADLSVPGPLIELARQFGQTTGGGAALRSAHDDENLPDRGLYASLFEPHDRGSILVRAVFDAFFATYRARVDDLLAVASGATARMPDGSLHPALVDRVAADAADTAQRMLDLCIRAIDYLPAIDVTFGDYLRALVTADHELNPEDRFDLRANLTDAFIARGVYPDSVLSLNEESLLLPAPPEGLRPLEVDVLAGLLSRWQQPYYEDIETLVRRLWEYARENHAALGFEEPSDTRPLAVDGFYTMFRLGDDGRALNEVGLRFSQRRKDAADPALGGIVPVAGTVVLYSGDGTPRYSIARPLPHDGLDPAARDAAEARMCATARFVAESDAHDPRYVWGDQSAFPTRMVDRYDFAIIHQAARRRPSGASRHPKAEERA